MNKPSRIAIANELLLPQIQELLSTGHTVTFMVRGHSMNPFLVDRRDKVIIAPLTEKPRTGTLLLAYEADRQRYVLHRLVKIQGDQYELMGDGNYKMTEIIEEPHLIGVVTAVIRKNKTYSTDSFSWKLYSSVWTGLLPFRRLLLGVWRRI